MRGFAIVVGLVLGGVALYLYYLMVRWLSLNIVPDFFFILCIIGAATAPVMYAVTARQQLLPEGFHGLNIRQWVALCVAVIMLTLIYFDFVFCLIPQLYKLHSWVGAFPQSVNYVWKTVVTINGYTWQALFLDASEVKFMLRLTIHPLGVMMVAAPKAVILTISLLAVRGMSSPICGTEQPAHLQYFFKQAFIDLQTLVRSLFINTGELFYIIGRWAVVINSGYQIFALWPLTITFFLALITTAFVAAAGLIYMALLHGLGLTMILASNFTLAFFLFLLERILMWIRSGYAKCPHSGCYKPIPLPTYACPNRRCGTRHDRLVPGKFGVLRRVCNCGTRLPTLFWSGKSRLVGFCPHCNKPINRELFGGNAHLPIYGGPSTGKTMYMMAATWQLMENHLTGISADLIDGADKKRYKNQWKYDFETGRHREKTHDRLPPAFLLSLNRNAGLPLTLYIYDAAGEVATEEGNLRGHRYLEYLEGLALVIDPLSFKSLKGIALRETSSQPSHEDPKEVLNGLVHGLREKTGLPGRKRAFPKRLAVILTKTDVPAVKDSIGLDHSTFVDSESWSRSGENESARIERWLEKQDPALHQAIRNDFKQVRFFASSPLGHSTNRRGAFSPKGVLAPFCWLMSGRRVITWPTAFKWGIKTLEISAVLALLFPLLTGFTLSLLVVMDYGSRFARHIAG